MADRIKTQRAEFDAMAALAEQWRRLSMTAVVDDDYPEVRHCYEGALATLLRTMQENKRFEQGNRYHLSTAQPNWREPLEALVEKWEKAWAIDEHAAELRVLIDKLAAQQGEGGGA